MLKLSKAAAHNGVMVALYPSPDMAATLAQPGGEPAEDLHVTLAYLGDAATLEDPERLRQAVAEWAAETAPIAGTVSGTGQFTAGPEPCTYASVDLPTLPAAREMLINGLWRTGFQASREHGFTPHMTLAYDARHVDLPNVSLRFDTVTLKVAGDRTDFPLYGSRAEWVVPIWKADDGAGDAPMIVYGVVLQPGVPDSQGDVISAAEIEKAAHRFMIESRKHDLQHDEIPAGGVKTVENYIAPSELEVAGRRVVKGSWVMGVAVYPEDVKQAVRDGSYTGFSIGGSGVRS